MLLALFTDLGLWVLMGVWVFKELKKHKEKLC